MTSNNNSNNNDVAFQIAERILLSDFIGRDIQLKQRGKEYVGLCPFHQEKTPSFYISDEKRTFYCFGCGISGNIFTYIRKRDGITFLQALKKLADLAGIKLPDSPIRRHNSLYKTLELATRYFESNIQKISYYLQQRNIQDCVDSFHLGYAPNNNELYEYLVTNGCQENDLIESGLFTNKYNNEFYLRFRNRLIFPIWDSSNRIIAFGGRAIDNSLPKYLNSEETQLFHKHEVLYAYNIAKEHVSTKNPFIVVEGYIDVIMLHKYGVNTAVGTMGTALSIDHIKALWKYSDEPIICMDGDTAGKNAMNRIAHLALEVIKPGKSLQFLELPNGYDPDLYIRQYESLDALRPLKLNDFLWLEYINEFDKVKYIPEKVVLWEEQIFKDLDTINHKNIKWEYKRKFGKNLWKLKRNKNHHTKKKYQAVSPNEQIVNKEYVLSYILVLRPNIFPSVSEQLSYIQFGNKRLEKFWTFIASKSNAVAVLEYALGKTMPLESISLPVPENTSETPDKQLELLPDAFLPIVTEIIKEGQKIYCIENRPDDEILTDWLYMFETMVSIPNEQNELLNAKNEVAQQCNEASWERLKALKMYSLNKRNNHGK